jgi:hypothetical protein
LALVSLVPFSLVVEFAVVVERIVTGFQARVWQGSRRPLAGGEWRSDEIKSSMGPPKSGPFYTLGARASCPYFKLHPAEFHASSC